MCTGAVARILWYSGTQYSRLVECTFDWHAAKSTPRKPLKSVDLYAWPGEWGKRCLCKRYITAAGMGKPVTKTPASLVIDPANPWLGISTDGLIYDLNGLVEVRCAILCQTHLLKMCATQINRHSALNLLLQVSASERSTGTINKLKSKSMQQELHSVTFVSSPRQLHVECISRSPPNTCQERWEATVILLSSHTPTTSMGRSYFSCSCSRVQWTYNPVLPQHFLDHNMCHCCCCLCCWS